MLTNSSISAVVAVREIKVAKDFYVNMLGLSLDSKPISDGLLLAGASGSKLYVYERPGNPPENTAVNFEVENIEEVVKSLESKGVKFEHVEMGPVKTEANHIATMGSRKMAWLKDPSGNWLGLGEGDM